MKVWKIHKAASAFPRMSAAEFNELKADIAAHGIRLPILVNKKKDTILDGLTRIRIAHDLKLSDKDIPLEVFDGSDEDAVHEIISRNIMRRHLTDDQRAALLAKLLAPQLEKEADARMKSGKAVSKSTQARTWQPIAKGAKVSQHKARSALTLVKHAPRDLDNVIAGKERLAAAAKKAHKKVKRPMPEKSLQERVEAKFLRMMESFAVTEYQAVREILRELLEKAMK
jgi:ParB-like chromosome segregation protein Spo0J